MSLQNARSFFAKASIVIIVFASFFVSNPGVASSDNKIQCAPQTAVTKTMVVASLSTVLTPAERAAPTENMMEKQTVAPRSEWIRVAPLVTKRCCGGYSCDQRSGTCVCKRWC